MESELTAQELAALLVDYFGAPSPKPLTSHDVQHKWGTPAQTTARAISIARVILREEYDVFLPVAHQSNGWLLEPTRDPIEAYRGERPQLQDVRTRADHTFDRVSYVLRRLERVSQVRARQQDRALRSAFDNLDAALDNVNGWIDDQIETRGVSA